VKEQPNKPLKKDLATRCAACFISSVTNIFRLRLSDSTVFDPEAQTRRELVDMSQSKPSGLSAALGALRHVDELMSSRSPPKGSGSKTRAEWSEHLLRSCSRKYVLVFANRSTKPVSFLC